MVNRILILSLLSILALSACTPTGLDPAQATEQALVAALTAVAIDDPEVLIMGTQATSSGDSPSGLTFQTLEVENNYPDSITFYVEAISEIPIRRVDFFYWLQGQEARNLERVNFSSGETVGASFTWDTERTTVAPSSPIYFFWELEDEDGTIFTSDELLVYYDDLRFPWNEISDDEIIVRWYEGNQEFGEFIFGTAHESLELMKTTTRSELEFPIIILIYANFEDFASGLYFVQDWVGGLSFSPLGVTSQFISPIGSEGWIQAVIPHEIAHLFFYQLVQTNISSWPRWLNEGFAQFFEFNSKEAALNQVEQAARNGALTPLRYIGGSFGQDPEEVNLAYAQSLSIVVFLLETWGEEGLGALIDEIRAGSTINDALLGAFGLTFEEFEARWITWLGIPVTPQPSPTAVPTFGVFGAPAATETPSP